MPYIDTLTTVKITPEQEAELVSAYGKAIELIEGKTEDWLMLNFKGESRMAFRGTTSPDIAMIDVYILGKAKDSEYDKLTEKLCEIVTTVLGVPRNRIYVKYAEYERWGYNGTNF
jgi:phenylpyruvate tautomerase PptA (4-oxalocrotonate tautomerase family)